MRSLLRLPVLRPCTPPPPQFHRSIPVADLHADPLLWTYRNLRNRDSHGHVDVPRLLEGNVAIQVLSSVTQAPLLINFHENSNATDVIALMVLGQMWPLRAVTSKFQRAMYYAQRINQLAAHGPEVRVITTREQLDTHVQAWFEETVQLQAVAKAAGKDAVAEHPSFTGVLLGVEGLQCAEGTTTGPAAAVTILVVESF